MILGRVLLPLAVGATALPAQAGEGDQILKKVEDTMNAPKDQVGTMRMILIDAGGKRKTREITMKQMGDNLRLIKFKSPAEVKGVGFLVRNDEEMYLYLPEFGKVRRIASHVKNESFMGTDFSYDDLGGEGYTKDNTAKLLNREGNTVLLELTPRATSTSEYSKTIMTVSTDSYMAVQIEFFDKKGRKWKVMKQEQIEKVSGYWVAKRLSMEDLIKKHSTVMEMADVRFDTGLSDSDFSRRKLKRSR